MICNILPYQGTWLGMAFIQESPDGGWGITGHAYTAEIAQATRRDSAELPLRGEDLMQEDLVREDLTVFRCHRHVRVRMRVEQLNLTPQVVEQQPGHVLGEPVPHHDP
jgi:hypothetical protein